ncbi:MAG: nuclear transport factor 2 family protein [Hyphomicrobiales bacterium]|nr:nuclear transport factor 2 family protein [Hyphomicrobiales bacterium]
MIFEPSDREQLYDLKVRYGRAVDTYDTELLRSCFADDATWRYDPIGGVGPLMRGWSEFSAFWVRMQEPMQCTHHFSNFTFDIMGDDAGYSCLLFAQHWPRGADFSSNVPFMTVGGRYDSRARRTNHGWEIYEHRETTLWSSGSSEIIWGAPRCQAQKQK